MKKANDKYTILYARLSKEDKNIGESDSIQNQKIMLEKYAEDNGFCNVVFKSDDGISGATFNRLAWNEVMEMIENNEVETLIVKDLSRLGRDYLQTGHLMEIVFPTYNVRFIAMNNNVDSLLIPDNDMSVFYNIMNDFYVKDCSKKIKAVKKSQAERGERIGSKLPYGYEKSPTNPKVFVPDEGCADVVRHIFKLCIQGRGPKQIATQLENEKVLNPTNYYYRKTGVELLNLNTETPYKWSYKTIARIIADEFYLGHTTTMKEKVLSYKNKKKVARPKEEWIRTENTHQPLVSKEHFDMAQSIRQQKKRTPKKIELTNVFSGLIKYADCGKPLGLQRYHVQNEDRFSFRCPTNRTKSSNCSPHTIRESQISTMVLDDLKRVTHFARQEEKLFAEYINQKNSSETHKLIEKMEKEIGQLKCRDADLTRLFKRIYEDNITG